MSKTRLKIFSDGTPSGTDISIDGMSLTNVKSLSINKMEADSHCMIATLELMVDELDIDAEVERFDPVYKDLKGIKTREYRVVEEDEPGELLKAQREDRFPTCPEDEFEMEDKTHVEGTTTWDVAEDTVLICPKCKSKSYLKKGTCAICDERVI